MYSMTVPGWIQRGCREGAPPLFFAEVGHLTLCGHLRQKKNELCKLTLMKIIFFYTSKGVNTSYVVKLCILALQYGQYIPGKKN